ncbi:MAG: hypothetical protein NT151_10730 [Acidobacteria bacterium]|nr:hypothetical protein [Acidobacteriota bacterium]
MSTTIVLVLAMGFLFGGMVLMLAMGYQDTEQKRALQAKARQAEAVQQAAAMMVALPGFFAPPHAIQPPTMVVFDDALVNRLEHHVRLEQTLVAQFVHHPSLDNLYRHPTTPVHMH